MNDIDALVRKAVGGDADALARLLDHCGPQVQRTLAIKRQWQSVLEPADVMQVTYFEAFMHIGRFDPDRSEPFQSWLQRIAENNLRDAIRGLQSKKRPQCGDRVQPSRGEDDCSRLYEMLGVTTTTPSRLASREERSAQLNAILDALPADYGRAVRLYDLQMLPIEDVAKQMGRSAGAVHMLRARAHDRLKQMLGGESQWFTSTA